MLEIKDLLSVHVAVHIYNYLQSFQKFNDSPKIEVN